MKWQPKKKGEKKGGCVTYETNREWHEIHENKVLEARISGYNKEAEELLFHPRLNDNYNEKIQLEDFYERQENHLKRHEITKFRVMSNLSENNCTFKPTLCDKSLKIYEKKEKLVATKKLMEEHNLILTEEPDADYLEPNYKTANNAYVTKPRSAFGVLHETTEDPSTKKKSNPEVFKRLVTNPVRRENIIIDMPTGTNPNQNKIVSIIHSDACPTNHHFGMATCEPHLQEKDNDDIEDGEVSKRPTIGELNTIEVDDLYTQYHTFLRRHEA